jgi:hypothetical protein
MHRVYQHVLTRLVMEERCNDHMRISGELINRVHDPDIFGNIVTDN